MNYKNLKNHYNNTIMKSILFYLVISILLFSSCKVDEPSPRSEVPDNMEGQWLYGDYSMTEFWDYDGSYSGNAFELALAFDFKKNGHFEFYFVTGGTSFGCRTEAFVFKKGTVQFNDNHSFTIYPTEGNSRGFYKGCAPSYQNYNRKIEKNDLKPEIYYYSFEPDSNGKEQLVIRFEQDDVYGSYFRPKQW